MPELMRLSRPRQELLDLVEYVFVLVEIALVERAMELLELSLGTGPAKLPLCSSTTGVFMSPQLQPLNPVPARTS
jgi:hypothetical protein